MQKPAKQPVRTNNLPSQPTPFIGRTNDVAGITELLADPACRLLTLKGTGGIGKTRLAIQAATEMLDNFAHGVYFVPLQPVELMVFFVSAITDAINFPLHGRDVPRVQLLNYLRDKEMLLVLDNFEQLLAHPINPLENGSPKSEREVEGSPAEIGELLTQILSSAPRVKFLVTSREALNLQEEWLFSVAGLSYPPSDQIENLEAYGAVQLFIERARRVRRDFSLVDEQAGLVRICQLVEGMPLAIELAAVWTKSLACEVIAAEILRNIDFLTTMLRNVPERQRSMRAVFDRSWNLLLEDERSVFKRLSVFRGGFERDAAERVAGASLPTLTTLVDKSLLRSESHGRYQIHEMLHQFAAEQLVQSPDDVAKVYDLHCAYYADFLHQRLANIEGGRQRRAMAEIGAELENIRAAWQWAVELAKIEEIKKSAQTLDSFYQFQSRFLEGANAFEKAIRSLDNLEATDKNQPLVAEVLGYLGWLCIRLGRFEKAKAVLERSYTIYSTHETPPPSGMGTDPQIPLAILAVIRGHYAEAAKLGERARRASEARADTQNLSFAYYVLTSASLAQGHYEAARQHAQHACQLARTADNRWFMAYCLNEWGNVARAMADYTEAKRHYRASYAIRQEFDDPEGMAVALNHLGRVAFLQDDLAEAQRLYQQGLSIYRDINDQGGLATSLNGLGTTAWAKGEYETARQHIREALHIATDIQFVPLILSILLSVGELMLHLGRHERGLELLAIARHHPASDRETRDRAQQYLAHHRAEIPPDVFAAATQRGTSDQLEAILITAQAELDAPIEARTGKGAGELVTSSAPLSSGTPDLIEPLTPRELEVLQLIAEGLTNLKIAEELIISVGTVKSYTSQIYGKLNVNSRTQAVARARELALLP